MQESREFTQTVYIFAKPWTEEMAYRAGVLEQGNFWGQVIMFVGIPLCFIAGVFVTLGYYSIILLVLLMGIVYVYKKGYLKHIVRRVAFNYS